MSANDGGPAFPAAWVNDGDQNNSAPDGTVCPPGWTHHMQGMTLRDYFAAAALQSPLFVRVLSETPKPDDITIGQHIARIAYAMAGRMLAERAMARR